jgi:hypothetical protein
MGVLLVHLLQFDTLGFCGHFYVTRVALPSESTLLARYMQSVNRLEKVQNWARLRTSINICQPSLVDYF